MRLKILFFILLVFAVIPVAAQSTNIEFPTPITTNTISGKIKARDIGDPRSTVYYYVFEATQGDVFLKIEAANLNGDIDVFYADSLRPVTKITLYADSTSTQTGREIYLRKPEKLILKVEGRTPNDDPATYLIKFEGSFLAMSGAKEPEQNKLPEIKTDSESEIKVNSVGTIIEINPKPTPAPKETIAKNPRRRTTNTTTTPEPVSTIKTPKTTTKKTTKPKTEIETKAEKKTDLAVSENLPKSNEPEKTETSKETEAAKEETEAVKEPEKPKTTAKRPTTKRNTPAKKTVAPKKEAPPKPNPAAELAKALENVRLIVEFKDGSKIERPMNDVIRFGVDKGVLTVVNKDGSIGRYSILEISKISVE